MTPLNTNPNLENEPPAMVSPPPTQVVIDQPLTISGMQVCS